MTTTLQTPARNAGVDAMVGTMDGGALTNPTGRIDWRDAGDVQIALMTDVEGVQNPAFGSAAAGVATLLGTPIEVTAIANGTITYADFLDTDGAAQWRSDVAAAAADIIMANPAVLIGEPVRLTLYTFTQQASFP